MGRGECLCFVLCSRRHSHWRRLLHRRTSPEDLAVQMHFHLQPSHSALPFRSLFSAPSYALCNTERKNSHRRCGNEFLEPVANDSSRTEVSSDINSERSEAEKIVDGMEFGELCNEFKCKSSPLVESTARQLVRDILELREGNRALGTFAVSVRYKDPVRRFAGREKYLRPLWVTNALDKPSVSVQEMVLLSTSELSIKWTIRGQPKSFIAGIAGDLVIRIDSNFTLNQISGQVIEHEESWDLPSSSVVAQAYFWTSRRLFAVSEGSKDLADAVKNLSTGFTKKKQNMDIYPDPSGDPTKFFQRDDSFQRDAYQIALLLAVLYSVIQFLRTTL